MAIIYVFITGKDLLRKKKIDRAQSTEGIVALVVSTAGISGTQLARTVADTQLPSPFYRFFTFHLRILSLTYGY